MNTIINRKTNKEYTEAEILEERLCGLCADKGGEFCINGWLIGLPGPCPKLTNNTETQNRKRSGMVREKQEIVPRPKMHVEGSDSDWYL